MARNVRHDQQSHLISRHLEDALGSSTLEPKGDILWVIPERALCWADEGPGARR